MTPLLPPSSVGRCPAWSRSFLLGPGGPPGAPPGQVLRSGACIEAGRTDKEKISPIRVSTLPGESRCSATGRCWSGRQATAQPARPGYRHRPGWSTTPPVTRASPPAAPACFLHFTDVLDEAADNHVYEAASNRLRPPWRTSRTATRRLKIKKISTMLSQDPDV